MTRPPFSLEMQEPPRTGERLSDISELVGETILAAFDNTTDGEIVLVTESKNWIVFDTEDGYGDERDSLIVKGPRYYGSGPQETLADYVAPRALLETGCINAAVYQELQAKVDAAEAEERARRANRLRAELAKLEGGAK